MLYGKTTITVNGVNDSLMSKELKEKFWLEKKFPISVCSQTEEEHQIEVEVTNGIQVSNLKPTSNIITTRKRGTLEEIIHF